MFFFLKKNTNKYVKGVKRKKKLRDFVLLESKNKFFSTNENSMQITSSEYTISIEIRTVIVCAMFFYSSSSSQAHNIAAAAALEQNS